MYEEERWDPWQRFQIMLEFNSNKSDLFHAITKSLSNLVRYKSTGNQVDSIKKFCPNES